MVKICSSLLFNIVKTLCTFVTLPIQIQSEKVSGEQLVRQQQHYVIVGMLDTNCFQPAQNKTLLALTISTLT